MSGRPGGIEGFLAAFGSSEERLKSRIMQMAVPRSADEQMLMFLR
jgi:hypothetical protein